MSQVLILIVAVIYLFTGADFIRTGQMGLGLTFLAYSVSNIGLYIAARGI